MEYLDCSKHINLSVLVPLYHSISVVFEDLLHYDHVKDNHFLIHLAVSDARTGNKSPGNHPVTKDGLKNRRSSLGTSYLRQYYEDFIATPHYDSALYGDQIV